MKAQILASAIALFINQTAIAQVDPDLTTPPACQPGNPSRREGCPRNQEPFCKSGQNPKTDHCRPLIFLPE